MRGCLSSLLWDCSVALRVGAAAFYICRFRQETFEGSCFFDAAVTEWKSREGCRWESGTDNRYDYGDLNMTEKNNRNSDGYNSSGNSNSSNSKWKQRFFTITAGQTVSLIGSSAVQFALIWWLASETQSPMMLGISGLAAFLPMTFLSPVAGVLADRFNRKAVCICADLFIGFSAMVFAWFMWNYDVPCEYAILVLFLRGIGDTFHQPSIRAIIPQLVPSESLVKANGWSQFMQSGAFMLGPVLGAALFAALPMPLVLLTDTLGAVIASLLLGAVKIPPVAKAGEESGNGEKKDREKGKFFRELKEGAEVYLEDPKLLILMAAQTFSMIFFLPLSSFYPLMTSSYFNLGAWHASAVELSFAVGMMGSAVLLGSVIEVKDKIKTAYIGLVAIGLMSALCGLTPPTMWGWWMFTFFCGLLGASGNIHSIPIVAYMQETIAPEKMGRAFSLMGMAGSLAMPIGLLVASPAAEKIGVHMWFLVTGIAIIVITICAVMANRKKSRE